MYLQRFEITIFIILGTTALLMLITVPGWPLFKTNEPEWLDYSKLSEYVREAGVKEKKDQ